jgi:hypothetical protein
VNATGLNLYLLQRRGGDGPDDRAMVVGALSEAHARVAAYRRSFDPTWTDNGRSTCAEIVACEGVIHTIYVSRKPKHDEPAITNERRYPG